ncbi:MAG: acyl-ACP--UDP-N-acetylglucosamine O-acyltransferase [Bacteroidia bacterium]|nr:acyl-ACP--UDP-N-acetylglucosamine O-acyltransferase [Bacteroidia bacterium]MCZ2276972.1 acyl-ACP--UDP-N-acetylglucosamine O-acyltransferase [Bacteroidia bacterium]
MISDLASVHPQAKIGSNVQIDPFVTIHQDVEIGDNCWIGSSAVIMDGARIGNGCKIFPGAVISAIPQDLKYEGEKTTVEIGENTTIREFVTINKGTNALGKTVIGNNCLIMAYVHVAHDCMIGNNCILANGVTLAGHIVIHDYAILGGLTAVHQFVQIGSHVMISGGSLVRKDVPPFVKAAREPLAYVGVNSIGLKRRGFSTETINSIQEIYRVLFMDQHLYNKALDIIEAEMPASDERDEIIRFVRSSTRGIMKRFSGAEE